MALALAPLDLTSAKAASAAPRVATPGERDRRYVTTLSGCRYQPNDVEPLALTSTGSSAYGPLDASNVEPANGTHDDSIHAVRRDRPRTLADAATDVTTGEATERPPPNSGPKSACEGCKASRASRASAPTPGFLNRSKLLSLGFLPVPVEVPYRASSPGGS